MSDSESHLARNVVGGVAVAAGGFLLFRGLRKYWWVILLIFAWSKISYWMSDEPKRDAVVATFARDKVELKDVTPLGYAGGKGVTAIRFTVHNGEAARILNVHVACKYDTVADPKSEPQFETRNAGFIHQVNSLAPGETQTIELASGNDGYLLNDADATSFRCKPLYDILQPDLLKARGRTDIDPLSKVDPSLNTRMEGPINGPYKFRIALNGEIINDTDQKLTQLEATCYIDTRYGETIRRERVSMEVDVAPGQAGAYQGKTDLMDAGTEQGFRKYECHLTRLR